eukprot:scaffold246545_cov16-Tisochrysis_lutea.AAC.1
MGFTACKHLQHCSGAAVMVVDRPHTETQLCTFLVVLLPSKAPDSPGIRCISLPHEAQGPEYSATRMTGIGCQVPAVHNLTLQDEVLIAGFGRRGHAVGDIPGVRFK